MLIPRCRSVVRRMNKSKKLVKKLAKKYDAFLASEALVRQIPRLLGPGLSKGVYPLPPLSSMSLTSPPSWKVPHSRLPCRRSQQQTNRSPFDHQVPAQESPLSRCRRWPCPNERRSSFGQRHAQCVSSTLPFSNFLTSR